MPNRFLQEIAKSLLQRHNHSHKKMKN